MGAISLIAPDLACPEGMFGSGRKPSNSLGGETEGLRGEYPKTTWQVTQELGCKGLRLEDSSTVMKCIPTLGPWHMGALAPWANHTLSGLQLQSIRERGVMSVSKGCREHLK